MRYQVGNINMIYTHTEGAGSDPEFDDRQEALTCAIKLSQAVPAGIWSGQDQSPPGLLLTAVVRGKIYDGGFNAII